ncbi:MAG TPA: hypothetical protein VHJ34_06320 [Actinomycetota bacterium]|nr:hypothetical protein [Actinomycetota bacterium]
MDENVVRERAQAHGDAVVAGDLRRAGGDLTKEAAAQAPAVMAKLPRPLRSARVEAVTAAGDDFVARTSYEGDDAATTVDSRWAERDGKVSIVELSLP